MAPHQNNLQYGFTKGASPLHAALMVTEAIAEQKDKKEPLFLATLDAQKAFDVVNHPSLLWKWHELGLRGTLWQVKDLMYQDVTTKVKWRGQLSEPFSILQGVRQGGVPSTGDYKAYINPLLNQLEESNVGMHIGSTNVGAPTCADDVMLLGTSIHSLQHLLTLAEKYASTERYKIHPTKSEITTYHTKVPNAKWNTIAPWTLNQKPVPVTTIVTHLGVLRESEKSTTISKFVSDRLRLGRRSLYALMGAGLHGLNGLSPVTCLKLYKTYIMPRLLSAVETVLLNITEMKALEDFHRKTMRQIQNLPPRTAIPAIYILMGTLPIEAEIDRRRLTLFWSICQDHTTKLSAIAARQLAMKSQFSHSWFVQITELCYKYGLPSPTDTIMDPPTKGAWKSLTHRAVNYYWSTKLKSQARTKSTLHHLTASNMDEAGLKPHNLWVSTRHCARDIHRASYQAKMLTGTYTVQADRHRYSAGAESAACPLCHSGQPETLLHLLAECDGTSAIREKFIQKVELMPLASDLFTQLVLDPTQYTSHLTEDFSFQCRLYCFQVHHHRAMQLGYRPYPGAATPHQAIAGVTAKPTKGQVAGTTQLTEGGGDRDNG
jgi:hypothetical protein